MATISSLANLLARLSTGVAHAASPYYQLRLRLLKIAKLQSARGLAGQPLRLQHTQHLSRRPIGPRQPFNEPSTRVESIPESMAAEDFDATPLPANEPLLPAISLQQSLAKRLTEVRRLVIPSVITAQRESIPSLQPSSLREGREFENTKQSKETPAFHHAQPPTMPELTPTRRERRISLPDSNLKPAEHLSSPPQAVRAVPSLAGFVPLFPILPFMIFRPIGAQDRTATPSTFPLQPSPTVGSRSALPAETFSGREAGSVGLSLERVQLGRALAMRQLGLPVAGTAVGSQVIVPAQVTDSRRPMVQESPVRIVSSGLPTLPQHEPSESGASKFAPPQQASERLETTLNKPALETRAAITLALSRYYSHLSMPLTRVLTEPTSRQAFASISDARPSLKLQPGPIVATGSLESSPRNLSQLITAYAEVESSQTRLQLLGSPAPVQRLPRVELPSIQAGSVAKYGLREAPSRTMQSPTISVLQPPIPDLPRVELPEISPEEQVAPSFQKDSSPEGTEDLRQKIAKILAEEARRYLGNE